MTKVSEALQAIFDYRDRVNSDSTKLQAGDNSCVVYLYNNIKGDPCARGYKGRALKPSFCFRYGSVEHRAEAVAKWMKSVQLSVSSAAQKKPRDLQEGDVLVSLWGYDQTNVDYFMVTKLIGKNSVEIVRIGCSAKQVKNEDGWIVSDEKEVVPDVSSVIGESFRRIANGSRVKINEYQSAGKHEYSIVDGEKVYKAMCATATH